MVNEKRFRFRKHQRILTSDRFGEIIRSGHFAADGQLVITIAANDLPYSRLGVTIPKRTGTAVLRNRWKRHIREAFRLQQHSIPVGYDIVVRPKRGAEPDARAIHKSLLRLVKLAQRRISNSHSS